MANVLCRICQNSIRDGLSFCDKHKQSQVSLVYQDLTGIKIEPNDVRLQSKICYECLDKLYSAYETRKLCIESVAYFRKQLQSETTKFESKEIENATGEDFENHGEEIKWDDVEDDLNLLEVDMDDKRVFGGVQSQEKDMDDKIETDPGITTHNTKGKHCLTCGKSFQCEATLNKHILSHEKLSNCPACPKTFSNTSNLKRHIATHSDKSQLNCDKCEKTFTETTALFEHLKIHRFDDAEKGDEHLLECEICKEKTAKPFSCKYCNKSFSQSSGLKIHTLIHMNIRPFACKVCHKTFTQYGHVREHLLTHTDDRPYTCTICNHSFRVKGNLKAHMLIHLGKKPHVCEHCSNRFNQSTHLRQHIIKKHKINS